MGKKSFLNVIINDGCYDYGRLQFGWSPTGDRSLDIVVDSAFNHYLVKELLNSLIYRKLFLRYNTRSDKRIGVIKLRLQTTKTDLIDYKWNFRVSNMVREHCELDHALSWLSTLGGAFSALGDYYSNCAETAGKISYHQMQVALKLRDPLIASRCRLYFALSLIQQFKFKKARAIVYHEYVQAKNSVLVDMRLVKMCKGIWSKLQHEHSLYVKRQNAIKLINKNVKF